MPAGERGRAAFGEWTRAVADPLTALGHPQVRQAGLLPLLLHSAATNGVELERGLRSVLRAARAHEELRLRAIGERCRQVLGAGERAIVLRGVALGSTVYPEPALRHCHDLDLLVASGDGVAARPGEFPVSRHRSLFGGRSGTGFADLVETADTADIAGVSALVLNPADALVHGCGHAATAGVSPLLAALDAWFLIDRNPQLDWERVSERAMQWGFVGVVSRRLAWVREELAAPVPARPLAQLRARARVVGPFERLRGRRRFALSG